MTDDRTLQFVDLERQYVSIKDEIDATVLGAIASTQYVLGEELSRFEQEFASYCEVDHCVGVGSGAAAIELALEAIGVARGDEVIVPANTFFGSVMPVLRIGATPVLVDCDEETATIDPERAAAAVGPRTRAIIAVHLYGQPADVDPLGELCSARGIALVEDACQAHGARYKGRRTGGLGTIAAFSFYPSKNLGAYGDGGAVTTDDGELADRIRILRNVGQTERYTHVAVGSNERLDTHPGRSASRQAPTPRPLEPPPSQPRRQLSRCPVRNGGAHPGDVCLGRARLAPLRRPQPQARRASDGTRRLPDRHRNALPAPPPPPASTRRAWPPAG